MGGSSGMNGGGEDTEGWYGDIAEILLFSGVLSDGDRGAVTRYLQEKYCGDPAEGDKSLHTNQQTQQTPTGRR